jgi:hypothetical protein
MRGIRRVRWVSFVAVVMVSACTGGGPDPTATTAPVMVSSSSMSTSATRPASATTSAGGTSTTTGPSATGVPPEAQADTADGAIAFVKFVVAEINRAYRTPDVGVLPQLLAPECLGCVALTQDLAATVAMKQRVAGDIWSTRSVLVNTWEPGRGTLTLTVDQNRVDYVDGLGRRVDTADVGTFTYILTLGRVGQQWRVTRWQKVVP